MKEKIKENKEKIKMNKQLPYLVGNVVEVCVIWLITGLTITSDDLFELCCSCLMLTQKMNKRRMGQTLIWIQLERESVLSSRLPLARYSVAFSRTDMQAGSNQLRI
jgi:hypothetical protein